MSETQEEQVDAICLECIHELWDTKKQAILKAADKLEAVGLSKRAICAELIHRLKGHVAERTVRRALGPDYTREYNRSQLDILSNSDRQDQETIEKEADAIAEKLGIDKGEEPDVYNDPVVKRITEKLKIMTDERNYYKEEAEKWHNQYDGLRRIIEGHSKGVVTEPGYLVLHPDSYEEVFDMFKKSPNGMRVYHDGTNIFNFKPSPVRTPTNKGIEQ